MSFSVYKNIYSPGIKFVKTKISITVGEKFCEVGALWDTGASKTHISKRIADLLALNPIKQIEVTGHRGVEFTNMYNVSLILPTGYLIENINVLSGTYDSLNVDMIIGMDIISFGDFHIDFTKENPVLVFKHPNDYDEDIFIETELF